MSRYAPGNIILVPFPHEGENRKVRPAIVIATQPNGDLCLCPIRSSPRSGITFIPISINDFVDGGLDLFVESFVQTNTVLTVKSGAVIGKKGRVTEEFLRMVRRRVEQ